MHSAFNQGGKPGRKLHYRTYRTYRTYKGRTGPFLSIKRTILAPYDERENTGRKLHYRAYRTYRGPYLFSL